MDEKSEWPADFVGRHCTIHRLHGRMTSERVPTSDNRSEALLEALVDTAVDGVIVIEADGIVRLFNRACERLFGYAPEEVIGHNVKMLMPSPYRDEHDDYLGRYRAGGEPRIIGIGREVVGRRKDGSTFPLDLSVGEASQGGRSYFVGILRDITARKAAEDALRESEARLCSVVETGPDALITIDASGTIDSFSPAAEALFGYAASEVVGRNVSLLMPAPYRNEHDGYLERYLRTGERRIIGIGRIVIGQRKDGTTFPMELYIGEFVLGDRRLFTGFVRDISDRRTTERRLHQMQTELRHVSRLIDMGEMASALAHELNQPLSAVMNYLQACRRMLELADGRVSERTYELMEKAVQQSARAGQIIRRLREFIEKGETERAQEDINRVVEEASALALTGAADGGIKVHIELHSAAPPVLIDRIQIQQVVLNLVRNAVEAVAGSERRNIIIRTRSTDRGVEVSITDTGPGLSEEVVARLFQPFVTTKRKGMGIGLSICRSIVESHGGRLWADANPDGGAIFAFALPCLKSDSDQDVE